MFRFRRAAAVASVVLLLAWVARGDGPANPTPPPVGGVPIEIVRANGTKLQGKYEPPVLRIKTDFGTAEIDTRKLKQVSLDKAEGVVNVSATLEDGSHQSGQLAEDAIPVTVDGKAEMIAAGTDAQQVNFLHPRDTSLLAAIIGLVTLAVMEIVLGVDNIIVLAIMSQKLPAEQQSQARRIGLIAALVSRLGLLFTLSWLLGLTRPVFTLPDLPLLHTPEARGISWRDIILLVGGAFLIRKSVKEMHEKVEETRHGHGPAGTPTAAPKLASFWSVIAQIAFIDIIFSLDSVITAVGMVDELWVMVGGMLIAVGIMMFAAGPISDFVDKHPTIKVLALSFLILIGVLLVAEGLGQHLDKGYIYFAMAFGVAVELVNLRLRGDEEPAKVEGDVGKAHP